MKKQNKLWTKKEKPLNRTKKIIMNYKKRKTKKFWKNNKNIKKV